MGQYTKDFLDHLTRVKRYSVHTLRAYKNDLDQFADFLQRVYGQDDPAGANAQMVRSWFASLSREGMSGTTFNRKASTLRSFYKYLEGTSPLKSNPMLRIKSLKAGKPLPVFVEEEQMANLLEVEVYDESFGGLRDRLLMELLYSTGIRLSELIQIRHRDMDTGKGQMRISGKGSKERIIPLMPHLVRLYNDYCRQKALHFDTRPDQCVLLTDKGNPLYPVFVQRKVARYLSLTTTKTKRSPHVMRHSFATHLLNKGADLNAIKELLGHASLSATQVYTHTSIDKIRSIYKQAHPKA